MIGVAHGRPLSEQNCPSPRLCLEMIVLTFLILTPLAVSSTNDVFHPGAILQMMLVREEVCLYLSFDEGQGQFAFDRSEPEFPTEENHGEHMTLGTSPFEDDSDPFWSSNTLFGTCLDIFEGDLIQGTEDHGIENEPFTLQMWFFPREVSGTRALFTFEDSDNEINGLFVRDGHLMTIWGGMERIYPESNLTTCSWYELGFMYTPPVESVYINGMMIGTTTWRACYPKVTDHHGFQIGAWYDEGEVVYPFNGMVDEIQLERGTIDLGGTSGFWNFQEGCLGIDPIVHDRSGNGNDGRCMNMDDDDLSEGTFGNGISFDGKDDYIECGNSPNYPFKQGMDWTVSMWIKPGTLDNDKSCNGISNCFIGLTSNTSSDQDIFEIGMDSSRHITYFMAMGEKSNMVELKGTSSHQISAITWTHLDVVLEGTIQGYVLSVFENTDSEIVKTISVKPLLENTRCNLTLGGSSASTPSFFSGSIDEVKILNRAYRRDVQHDSSRWNFDGDTADDSKFQNMDLSNTKVMFSSTLAKYDDRCAFFNGIDAYLFHTSPKELMPELISIRVWIYPFSIDGGDIIVGMEERSGEDIYSLALDGTGHVVLFLKIQDEGSPARNLEIVSRFVPPLRKWTHITAEYDGIRASIHINGHLDNYTGTGDDRGSIVYGTDGHVFSIGVEPGSYSDHFYHGYMDELEISGSPAGEELDLDGDGMCYRYEISRSVDSCNFDPKECNARYALLAGNNDNTSDKNVGYASAHDARDMRYLLRSLGYNECDILFLVYEDNILVSQFPETYYIDGKPTREGFVRAIELLARYSTGNDLVLLFYTGHGDQVADFDGDEDYYDFSSSGKNMSKQDEGLALSNDINGDPDRLLDDDYADLSLKIRAKQMLHILISCNSGGFFEDIAQGYINANPSPWSSWLVLTPAHENDVAYVKDKVNSFFGASLINKAMRRIDTDDYSDRRDFGRVSWDPDVDVTINNMMFMEQDGAMEDNPTKIDSPSHWQRNHYTEEGYQPGFANGMNGQDFPDQELEWGKNDQCVRWVSGLDYSPSNQNFIVDIEEAFYFSAHNEYLGEGEANPEADPERVTSLGDDPLIFDSHDEDENRTYL